MSRGTVNKVIILGRLGQDPEVRATASGTQVVNLNVATTEIGKADQSGQRQETTEWHRITIFGRMAENAAQYLRKGSQVYIEGRLSTRKWQDANGQDRYSTDIIANEMQFIGGGGQQNQGFPQAQPMQQNQGFQQPQQAPQQQPQGFGHGQPSGRQALAPQAGGWDDLDDGLPF